MTIFLDTGIIVAGHNKKDPLHEKALRTLSTIATGQLGSVYTSEYIFDESLALAFLRTGSMETSKELAQMLLKTKSITLLHIDENTFKETTAQYLTQTTSFSFTDCTTLQLMKQNNIRYVATFDDEFKKVEEIELV